MARTMMVVMPYFPKDLKAVFRSAQRHDQKFSSTRAARITYHLLLAVRHLKAHDIVHRDIKLDNVLLANVGTDEEAAVLTDFGMCFDLRKNQVRDSKVEMKFDGFRRGGAPIALAPEVVLPKPGPDCVLDYSRNDEWAVGMVSHELLTPDDATPFADMEHPATYSDAGYRDAGIPNYCKPIVRDLLCVDVMKRLDAAEGSRQAKQLLSLCMLEDTHSDTKGDYQSGSLTRIFTTLKRCETDGAALSEDVVAAKQALEAHRDQSVATANSALKAAADKFEIKVVRAEIERFKQDAEYLKDAWIALDQHRLALEKKIIRRLESAAEEADEDSIQVALAAAADYGEAVQDARQMAITALSQARARKVVEAAVARGEELLASEQFTQAIKSFKDADAAAVEVEDRPLKAHIKERLKVATEKAKKKAETQGGGMAAPPTAQELGRALRTVISAGVPLWNSGDFAGCAREYKRVCSQYMHADAGLAKAVSDCEGQSTGSAQDSQGWILRRAMDECLEKIRAGTWEPTTPPLKVVLLCADFADHRADVQKHLARGLGVSTVPTMDLHEGVPSSVTLSHYDVAVVFTASWGAGMMRGYPSTTYDRNAVGDRLADFVDGGGSVVMMVRVCPVPSVACVHQ
jgi:hypothetical protein